MECRGRTLLIITVLLLSLSCVSQPAWPCAWPDERLLFTDPIKPDAPLEAFLQGRLGILEPTYRRIFLLGAYRQLAGPALDAEEQVALKALMERKLEAETSLYQDASASREQEDEDAALKKWLDARRQVKKEGDKAEAARSSDFPGAYRHKDPYFKNCLDDAFMTATKTLQDRIGRFGADSPEVKLWLEAQDKVFDNCSGKEDLPAPPEQGLDPLVVRDRVYQLASAHFYLLHLDKAQEMFEAIGKDPDSPWRRFVPYLVGRVLLRKASLAVSGDEGEADASKLEAERQRARELLAEAEKQFTGVLADPSAAELHTSARGLLRLVRSRLRPAETRSALAEAVLHPVPDLSIDKAAADYTVLLDRFMKEKLISEVFEDKEFAGMSGGRQIPMAEFLAFLDEDHDMTDWILTFQAGGKAGLDRALKKYEEKASLPWLITVLSEITQDHPGFAAIAEKASQVQKDSPAFWTVNFHLARCAVEAGRTDDARSMLDALLSVTENGEVPLSAVNRLLALRFAVAGNMQDFIRYAPRVPVRAEYGENPPPKDLFFDEDSAQLLNEQMPMDLLRELAKSEGLPEYLRLSLGRALWVRALVLGNDAVGSAAASLLKEMQDTELLPYLEQYLNTKDSRARRFAGIFTVLKMPGLRPYMDAGKGRDTLVSEIDNFRNNWWGSHERAGGTGKETKRPEQKFPSAEQKSAAAKEFKALTAEGAAPTFLCRFVASYGRERPAAPGLPEALHLAVKSSRFGNVDNETGKYSKEAFQLLHRKFGKSEWAEKTPYWFK